MGYLKKGSTAHQLIWFPKPRKVKPKLSLTNGVGIIILGIILTTNIPGDNFNRRNLSALFLGTGVVHTTVEGEPPTG